MLLIIKVDYLYVLRLVPKQRRTV